MSRYANLSVSSRSGLAVIKWGKKFKVEDMRGLRCELVGLLNRCNLCICTSVCLRICLSVCLQAYLKNQMSRPPNFRCVTSGTGCCCRFHQSWPGSRLQSISESEKAFWTTLILYTFIFIHESDSNINNNLIKYYRLLQNWQKHLLYKYIVILTYPPSFENPPLWISSAVRA